MGIVLLRMVAPDSGAAHDGALAGAGVRRPGGGRPTRTSLTASVSVRGFKVGADAVPEDPPIGGVTSRSAGASAVAPERQLLSACPEVPPPASPLDTLAVARSSGRTSLREALPPSAGSPPLLGSAAGPGTDQSPVTSCRGHSTRLCRRKFMTPLSVREAHFSIVAPSNVVTITRCCTC